ncbi:MAG: Gfo/Idh/MocA family oxidoreductase [Herpetosiphon sp.]
MSEGVQTKPLRVGVIGLGFAGETHLKSYLQIRGVEAVALAGLEPEKLAQLGAIYHVPYLYEHYEELLARDDLDVISVCVPNHLHAPISIAALASGRHVLCEKPLARTSAEAAAIVQAATDANRVLHVAFNHRERGDVQVLKRYVTSGQLGHIYYAKASWMRRSGIPGLGSWFTNKNSAGGGPLIDLGVHVLDLALFLLGEPEVLSVSAATYAELGPRGRGSSRAAKFQLHSAYEVEDLATAFLRLADGSTLLLESSWATYGSAWDDFGVTLYGNEGGAEIRVKNYSWEDTLRIYTDVADGPAEIRPVVTKGDGHLTVVQRFIAAIRDGNWAAHTGNEGLRRTRIIDACYTSAREGHEVRLDHTY